MTNEAGTGMSGGALKKAVLDDISPVIAAAAEFKSAVDAALAEARSLFSSIITEGSSQQARIHGERSAAVRGRR